MPLTNDDVKKLTEDKNIQRICAQIKEAIDRNLDVPLFIDALEQLGEEFKKQNIRQAVDIKDVMKFLLDSNSKVAIVGLSLNHAVYEKIDSISKTFEYLLNHEEYKEKPRAKKANFLKEIVEGLLFNFSVGRTEDEGDQKTKAQLNVDVFDWFGLQSFELTEKGQEAWQKKCDDSIERFTEKTKNAAHRIYHFVRELPAVQGCDYLGFSAESIKILVEQEQVLLAVLEAHAKNDNFDAALNDSLTSLANEEKSNNLNELNNVCKALKEKNISTESNSKIIIEKTVKEAIEVAARLIWLFAKEAKIKDVNVTRKLLELIHTGGCKDFETEFLSRHNIVEGTEDFEVLNTAIINSKDTKKPAHAHEFYSKKLHNLNFTDGHFRLSQESSQVIFTPVSGSRSDKKIDQCVVDQKGSATELRAISESTFLHYTSAYLPQFKPQGMTSIGLSDKSSFAAYSKEFKVTPEGVKVAAVHLYKFDPIVDAILPKEFQCYFQPSPYTERTNSRWFLTAVETFEKILNDTNYTEEQRNEGRLLLEKVKKLAEIIPSNHLSLLTKLLLAARTQLVNNVPLKVGDCEGIFEDILAADKKDLSVVDEKLRCLANEISELFNAMECFEYQSAFTAAQERLERILDREESKTPVLMKQVRVIFNEAVELSRRVPEGSFPLLIEVIEHVEQTIAEPENFNQKENDRLAEKVNELTDKAGKKVGEKLGIFLIGLGGTLAVLAFAAALVAIAIVAGPAAIPIVGFIAVKVAAAVSTFAAGAGISMAVSAGIGKAAIVASSAVAAGYVPTLMGGLFYKLGKHGENKRKALVGAVDKLGAAVQATQLPHAAASSVVPTISQSAANASNDSVKPPDNSERQKDFEDAEEVVVEIVQTENPDLTSTNRVGSLGDGTLNSDVSKSPLPSLR